MLAELHFLRPGWLVGFVPLIWLVFRTWRGQSAAGHWRVACDPELLQHLLLQFGQGWQRRAAWLLAITGSLALLALAGPSWQRQPQPVVRDDQALVILLDLSRSMDVRDQPPSRLQQVRYRLVDLLERYPGGYAALVGYAGLPFLVSPLTDDFATITSQLQALNTQTMPAQGSRADLALDYAAELLQNAGHAHGQVLLVSDGLAQASTARQRAGQLLQRGYRVAVLGVGTVSGGPVPVSGGGFARDVGGSIVISRLQRGALQAVAQAGGGDYRELGIDDAQLDFSAAGAALEDTERLASGHWLEQGPWLLLPLLLLCALGFRRGGSLVCVLCTVLLLPDTAGAAGLWEQLWSRPDQQAEQLFHEGRTAAAAERFQDALWRATAHYREGEYQQALAALRDTELDARGQYLRGNALAQLERYEEAVAAYDATIAAAGAEPRLQGDAEHNRRQVQALLDQQGESTAGEGQGENAQAAEDAGERAGESGEEAGEAGEGSMAEESAGGAADTGEMAESQEATEASRGDSASGQNATAAGGQGTGEPEPDGDASGAYAGAGGDAEQADDPEQQMTALQEQGATGDTETGEGTESPDDAATPLLQQRKAQALTAKQREAELATEAWLRSISGDTGNYLRRKFHQQYQQLPPPQRQDEADAW